MIGQTYSHQYDMLTVTTFPTVTVGNVANICPHCEGNHIGDRCPYIKAIEYDDAGKVRLVLSDEQYNDVTTRRADGESWAGLARAYGMTQTTLMAAYARQTAAKRQETPQ